MELSMIQKVAIWTLPVLFAIVVHEVAHGWIASLCGDRTARLSGRLTLNPLKHIDIVGTVIVPLLMLAVTNFIFGWAKPVPVDARNMRHPRRDMIMVSAAGPISNFLMALFWAGVAKASLSIGSQNTWLSEPLYLMGQAGIMINIVLAVLNCLPIPPLDGGRIMLNILPPQIAWKYLRIEPYSFFILIILLASGVLSSVMGPIVYFMINWIMRLFGLG